MKKINKHIFRLDYYYGILEIDDSKRNIFLNLLYRMPAYVVVSIDRFLKNRSSAAASALTFYSTLAIVPMLALILAIAKGFNAAKAIEDWLTESSFANQESVEAIVSVALKTLNYSEQAYVAGIGIVVLFWSMISMLSNAEVSINRIWGIYKNRDYIRRIVYYFTLLVVSPFVIIIISGLNVFTSSFLGSLSEYGWVMSKASEVLISAVGIIPYILVWGFYFILYKFTPFTKVDIKSAVVAGILAGTVFQLVQWFYLKFQIGVTEYNAMYGGFAALPLMLVWLNLSWNIVLWGAELSYVVQNGRALFRDNNKDARRLYANAMIAIGVMKHISQSFVSGNGGCTIETLCEKSEAKPIDVEIVVDDLLRENILIENRTDSEISYFPHGDPHSFSVSELIIRISHLDECKDIQLRERILSAIRTEFKNDKFVN